MSKESHETGPATRLKAKWVKPAVGQLKAGAAEIANGVQDDGDGNTIPNDTS